MICRNWRNPGAAGIGLFRTELQFMVGQSLPRSSDQLALYRTVLDAAGSKPVTFRTLDIGGDKVLPYFRAAEEENPALGWRAIRLTLDRPGLLRTQMRALLKAAAGRELRSCCRWSPSWANCARRARSSTREVRHLSRLGHGLAAQPAVRRHARSARAALPARRADGGSVDFVSVGSNDLFQFVMAADRGNTRCRDRFDTLSRPFPACAARDCRCRRTHNTPVTLCGELAGKPISAMALIGIGYRSISMSPAAIGPVKAMLLSLDARLRDRTAAGT